MRGLPIFTLVLLTCLLVWIIPLRAPAQPGMEPLPIAQETDVERLADLLDVRDANVRIQAATRLKQLGDMRGFNVLTRMLKDTDPTVRLPVVRALGNFGDARAADLLAPLLKDADAGIRTEVAFSLGALHDARAVAPLLDLLTATELRTRERVIGLLGPLGDPRVVPALITALKDTEAPVRLAAVRVLANMNDTRAAEPLLAMITDRDITVRREATALLGRLAARCTDAAVRSRIIDSLLAAIKSPQVSLPLRIAAVSALGEVHDPRLVPVLCLLLDDSTQLIRLNAAQALGTQQDVRAVPSLMARAHDADPAVRGAVLTSLGQIGDPRAADLLLAALGDGNSAIRGAASQGIFNLLPDDSARIADRLATLLTDGDREVRRNAVTLLGNLGDPRAIDATIVLLKDAQPNIRGMALQTLLRIDDPRATTALITALPDMDDEARNMLVYPSSPGGSSRMFLIAQAMLKQPKAPLREWGIRLLQQSSDLRAIDSLSEVLNDQTPSVRIAALQILPRFCWPYEPQSPQLLASVTALAHDTDPATRSAALGLLVPLRAPTARELLLAALHDPNPQVQSAAASALGSMASMLARNDEQIVMALLEAGKATDSGVRRAVISSLQSYRSDHRVSDMLFAASQDPNTEVRNAGILSFISSNDPHATEVAVALLKTPQDLQQWGWWLGRINDPRVTDALLALLPNATAEMKPLVINALAQRGEPRAAASVLAILKEQAEAANPTDWNQAAFARQPQVPAIFREWQSQQAFQMLGASAVEPLTKLLADEHRSARVLALIGLAQRRDARAFDPLLTSLRGDDAVFRCYAARGLGALADVRALTPLLASLHDAEPGVRAEACQALGQLGDTRATTSLLDMLPDPQADIRFAAATALGLLKDARAVTPLIGLARGDLDAGVRGQAIEALGRLRDARAFEVLVAALRDRANRMRAITALGELRDPRALDPLMALAKSKSGIQSMYGVNAQQVGMIYRYANPSNGDLSQQVAVATALGKIGDPRAIDALLYLLREYGGGYQTYQFIAALSAFDDARVIETILTGSDVQRYEYSMSPLLTKAGLPVFRTLCVALKDKDASIRRRASLVIAGIVTRDKSMDAPTGEALLAALHDEDSMVGGNVTKALLAANETRAVPEIAKLLADQSGPAYIPVVDATQIATDPRLLAPLLTIATQADGNSNCRTLALHGIANIARTHPTAPEIAAVVAPLIAVVNEHYAPIRGAVVQTLGSLHDPRVVPALLPLLQEEQPHIRHAAALALAEAGDQHAIEPLLSWINDLTVPNRWESVKALEHFNQPQVVDALIAGLRDPAFYVTLAPDQPGSVREQAALSLGALSDPRAVPALIEALDYGYLPGRRRAAEALGMLKDKRAVAPLIAALRHFAGDAASAPAAALKAITGQNFGLDADRWQVWWDGVGKQL